MKQSVEVDFCKNLFFISSRSQILDLLNDSNLNDKERDFVKSRYISGLSVKEMCEVYHLDEGAYKKMHRRILAKFYLYIKVNKIA